MHSLLSRLPLTVIFSRPHLRHALHTSPPANRPTTGPPHIPKHPLELDPALQALLQDTDLSFLRGRPDMDMAHGRKHRELELIDADVDVDAAALSMDGVTEEEAEEMRLFPRSERKSPAASFGSRTVGTVALPFELQRSILRLISEADQQFVHADAAQLSKEENAAEDAWSTRYTPPESTGPTVGSRMSNNQARSARRRDGTAFASVVMPAQYAVITAVLSGIVTRLGPQWAEGVGRVVEWGSGTGAGMWAALHMFGRATDTDAVLAASRITSYIGIEKREGLSNIARRLLRDIPLGETTVSLQTALHPFDSVRRVDGLGTIALSAFALCTLNNLGLRRQMVRDMWDSGADVIVVIDDASTEGFSVVAEARELLLKFGRREVEAMEASGVDPTEDGRGKRGAHVIAPCPHDFTCPLALATGSGVRCTFEQRLERPSFVRRTKNTGQGEEDVGYAYVVVRRGERPQAVGDVEAMTTAFLEGRVGAIGRGAEEAVREKELAREQHAGQQARWVDIIDEEGVETAEIQGVGDADKVLLEEAKAGTSIAENADADAMTIDEAAKKDADAPADTAFVDHELEDALRLEAYHWPRINFPPLKRSGHILVDACMPNGNEMRLTFPRSQGKQIFYDARKSAWGDLFPHPPKHRPIPRYAGPRRSGDVGPREKGRGRGRGGEGALAKVGLQAAGRGRWDGVMNALQETNRWQRKERRQRRCAKEMTELDE